MSVIETKLRKLEKLSQIQSLIAVLYSDGVRVCGIAKMRPQWTNRGSLLDRRWAEGEVQRKGRLSSQLSMSLHAWELSR